MASFVDEYSAVSMDTGLAILYRQPAYQHDEYYRKEFLSSNRTAVVEWSEYVAEAGSAGRTKTPAKGRTWFSSSSEEWAARGAITSVLEDWR